MDESPSPSDVQRLRALLAMKCDLSLAPAEHEELEEILLSSKGARDEFWDAIRLHAELEWQLGGKQASDELVTRLLDDVCEVSSPRDAQRSISRSVVSVVAIAAALLLCLGGWLLFQSADLRYEVHSQNSPGGEAVDDPMDLARLSPIVPGSRWSAGKPGDLNPASVGRGDTVSVDRGAVRLQMTSETVAELEAPLVVQLLSVDRVRVLRGRMKVDVAKGEEGFTIETTAAEVIDLGTSFSVEVANGDTDVVVFQGAVNLNVAAHRVAGNVTPSSSKRFRAGEAVRVSSDGTLSRIANVIPSIYQEDGVQKMRPPVISSVRDNIAREELWSFYEIVRCGMEEDARAFVDRLHEWNGVSDEGMPPYLLGGDYVKTFNDDKAAGDLSIDVVLERPAIVYVLLDKRIAPPRWLVDDFVDTDDEIGVDEAWDFPELSAEAGSGQSVDRTHSIWKRVVDDGGVVRLGANGRLPGTKKRGTRAATNMYGIVVVPLDGR